MSEAKTEQLRGAEVQYRGQGGQQGTTSKKEVPFHRRLKTITHIRCAWKLELGSIPVYTWLVGLIDNMFFHLQYCGKLIHSKTLVRNVSHARS